MPNYIEYYDNEGRFDVAYSGEPEGKKAITNTDEVSVALYATAQVVDEQLKAENIRKNRTILGIEGTFEGVSPSGTINITANDTYDVTEFSSAIVDVPQPPAPSGKKPITTTDETDVASYATAQVSDANLLPENIVDGKTILGVEGTYAGIIPTGTKEITDTALTDVSAYENAQVVDENLAAENIVDGVSILGVTGSYAGIIPTGKKNITDTTVNDVTEFASAQVVDANLIAENIKKDVSVLGVTGTYEGGIVPTGTINITENGTYDVTDKASAVVDVEADQLLGYAATISGSNPFYNVSLPQKFKCEFYNLTTANTMFGGAKGVQEIDVILPNNISLRSMINNAKSVQRLKIRPTPYTPADIQSIAQNASALEVIDCELDLSQCGLSAQAFAGAYNLTSLNITPNSISVAYGNALDYRQPDNILIVVANGLNINAPSTFSAALDSQIKTRMNNLMGDVNSDNLFVANAGGTMSLTQFITNVKGWTIS